MSSGANLRASSDQGVRGICSKMCRVSSREQGRKAKKILADKARNSTVEASKVQSRVENGRGKRTRKQAMEMEIGVKMRNDYCAREKGMYRGVCQQ